MLAPGSSQAAGACRSCAKHWKRSAKQMTSSLIRLTVTGLRLMIWRAGATLIRPYVPGHGSHVRYHYRGAAWQGRRHCGRSGVITACHADMRLCCLAACRLQRSNDVIKRKDDELLDQKEQLSRLRDDFDELRGQYAALTQQGHGREQQRELSVRV